MNRYRTSLVLILICGSLQVFGQLDTGKHEYDSTNIKIMHISTRAYKDTTSQITVVETVSLPTDFVSLSLVDSVLYRDFEEGSQAYKNFGKSVMITVTKADNEQRTEFVLLFYQKALLLNDKTKTKQAYTEALAEMKKKYKALEFKSRFFENGK